MFEVQRYKKSFVNEKNTDKLRFLQILFICQSTFTRDHQISHTATRTFLRLYNRNRKIAFDAFLKSCTENIFLTLFRLYSGVAFDQFFIFLWKEAKIC